MSKLLHIICMLLVTVHLTAPVKAAQDTASIRQMLTMADHYYARGDIPQGNATFKQAFDQGSNAIHLQLEVCTRMAAWLLADPLLYMQLLKYRDQLLADHISPQGQQAVWSMISSAVKILIDTSLNYDLSDKLKEEKALMLAIGLQKRSPRINIAPHQSLSYIYYYGGNLGRSLLYALEAVKIKEKGISEGEMENPYIQLGRIYFEEGNTEQSIAYYRKAISTLQNEKKPMDVVLLKMFTKALIKDNRPGEALPILQEYNNKQESSYTGTNKRLIVESMGNCYYALGQYDKAEKYYLENLDISKKMNKEDVLVAYLPLGKLYVQTKRYDKARPYLNELLADTNRYSVPVSIQQDVHHLLFLADSASGKYLSAIRHLNQQKAKNDSIFNDTKNKQFEELKVQYETEKKEQNIQLLVKQGQLQTTALQQAKFSRNALITGAVALVLLLGLVYNRYLIKQKSNRQLDIQRRKINMQYEKVKELNAAQEKLLHEKEWLMKEVHHRVKNNLQIVISLLHMQTDYLKDESATSAFIETCSRIRSISLIHQRLYKTERMTAINMSDYIRELVSYLEDSCTGRQRVYFDVQTDHLCLDVSQSVPVGLIINEAVTNAIKYAFGSRTDGMISVWMKADNTGMLSLTIADNGAGLPENFDEANNDSMGFQLMKTMSEQLEGTMTIQSNKGLSIIIQFSPQLPTLTQGDIQTDILTGIYDS